MCEREGKIPLGPLPSSGLFGRCLSQFPGRPVWLSPAKCVRPGGLGFATFRAEPLDMEGTFQKTSSRGKDACVWVWVVVVVKSESIPDLK